MTTPGRLPGDAGGDASVGTAVGGRRSARARAYRFTRRGSDRSEHSRAWRPSQGYAVGGTEPPTGRVYTAGEEDRVGTGDTVVIEAALNGGRGRTEHPAVPFTPEEIAAETLR